MDQKAISREDMIKKLVAADLNGLTAEKASDSWNEFFTAGGKAIMKCPIRN